MPSTSKSQRRLFGMVHALQKGDVQPSKVSTTIRKLAKNVPFKSVKDFAATKEKDLPLKMKMEMLSILKEFQSPAAMLQETNINPIAKEFTKTGIYDRYIQKFVGIPFSQKELESINNYTDVKPSKIDTNQVKYESSDQFNNNTTTTLKKLREGSQFVYTSFTKYSQTQKQDGGDKKQEPGQPPPVVTPVGPQPEDIIVSKSTTFVDDTDGSKILSNFLRKLDL